MSLELGQLIGGSQHRPSSMQPLQSLSRPSQDSPEGEMPPSQGPQVPNSPEERRQICWPSAQPPSARRPGGPRKQARTAPGRQTLEPPSSICPLQLSSRPLLSISAARQPVGTGLSQGIFWSSVQLPVSTSNCQGLSLVLSLEPSLLLLLLPLQLGWLRQSRSMQSVSPSPSLSNPSVQISLPVLLILLVLFILFVLFNCPLSGLLI